MPLLDLSHFADGDIPSDTIEINKRIETAIEEGPDMWSLDLADVRAARRQGKGIFPLEPFAPDAQDFQIEGKGGPVTIRAIRPDNRAERGSFLHFHGGGWTVGNADMQDQRLKALANDTGLACLSVEYRLAPENPYPAGPDDCEAAALWLLTEGAEKFNTEFLAIGGESAGAHLAVNALLRLRDRHNITERFHAAILIAGCFDLGMTPSAANYDGNLVLRNKDMVNFSAGFLANNEDRRNPDVSPLYAKLDAMPPAHFSVGTNDALLDDTIFMATRWRQVQADTEMDIYPGACHVFQYFPDLEQSKQSAAAVDGFLNALIEKQTAS